MGNHDSHHMSPHHHHHKKGSDDLNEPQATNPTPHHPHKQKVVKHRSLSPKNQPDTTPRRSESFKNKRVSSVTDSTTMLSMGASPSEIKKNRPISRRAKSFRYQNRNIDSSFRIPVCSVTGLNVNQKKLLKLKWADLDKQAINDMGKNIFETTFRRDPKLLKVIGLEKLASDGKQSWREHTKFRIHFQRFANMLNEVMRSLEEPRLTIDRLLEFGAEYALCLNADAELRAAPHVPSSYWDTLIFGFNNAAKDLQVESSRGSESPSLTTSTERRFLLPSTGEDVHNNTGHSHCHCQRHSNIHFSAHHTHSCSCTYTSGIGTGDNSPLLSPAIQQSSSCNSRSNHCCSSSYGNNCNSAPPSCRNSTHSPNFQQAEFTGCHCCGTSNSTPAATPSPSVFTTRKGFTFGSVCPVEAEAWNLLAVYIVGQIKFGYSMEMLLQEQLKRMNDLRLDEEEEEESLPDDADLKNISSLKTTKTLRSASTIQAPPIFLQCSMTMSNAIQIG
jgi:hypothetical protein